MLARNAAMGEMLVAPGRIHGRLPEVELCQAMRQESSVAIDCFRRLSDSTGKG